MGTLIEAPTGSVTANALAGCPYRVALTGAIRVHEDTSVELFVDGARFGHLIIAPSAWLRLPWSGYFVAPETEHGQVEVSWVIAPALISDEAHPLGIEVRPA